jgi:hypothetical protein
MSHELICKDFECIFQTKVHHGVPVLSVILSVVRRGLGPKN